MAGNPRSLRGVLDADACRVLASGTLASVVSSVVLVWRGRRDAGSATSALNAPSQWVWGREALCRDDATLRHTLVGALVHHLSSLFWAVGYAALQRRRRALPVADAALVTGVAATVDLCCVPPRLRPGFERRLSRRGLWWVYGSFAAGLALGGMLSRGRAAGEPSERRRPW